MKGGCCVQTKFIKILGKYLTKNISEPLNTGLLPKSHQYKEVEDTVLLEKVDLLAKYRWEIAGRKKKRTHKIKKNYITN